MSTVCAFFEEFQTSRPNYGKHPTCKKRKAIHHHQGDESLRVQRIQLSAAIKRTSALIAFFACLVASSAFSDVVIGKEKAASAPASEKLAEAEKKKWNIPERFRIGADQTYGDLSTPARACNSCIKAWQAIDIAKAYLDKYPIKYLNVRAEYMEGFPWNGEFRPNLSATDDEWHFGYKIGLWYSGDLDSPFRYSGSPGSQSRAFPPETEPHAGTWRVWYQTGWVERDEIAKLVSTGRLPEGALEWERQPLEEWVLVHAMTGKMEPTWYGRDGAVYFDVFERGLKNMRFHSAQKAAKERSKLWITKKKGSPDEGKTLGESPKDRENRVFETRVAEGNSGKQQENASGQYRKRLYIGTCAWGSNGYSNPGNPNCNTLVTDDHGNCLDTVTDEHRNYCSSYVGLLKRLDTIADTLGVQIGCANNDGCSADVIVHVESSAKGAEVLSAYSPVHDSMNFHKEGDSCDGCAGTPSR